MEELKPCPFCGGEALLQNAPPQDNYFVSCRKCGATTMKYFPGKEEAVVMWNRRAAPENKADPDGLHVKYDVRKLDGTPVFNCFVLRPNKDPSAVAALRAYAEATENKALAEDIYRWVGKPENKPLTCEGCKHESDIEFPCDFCCRNFKDRYAARKPEGSAP